MQQYRGRVHQAFPDMGPAFNERKAAWRRVWGQWQAAGSPSDRQDRLIVWLAEAIRSTTPGKIGPLPADPAFFPQGQAPPAVAKEPTRPAERPREAPQKPPKDVAAAKPVARPAAAKRAMEQPPRLSAPAALYSEAGPEGRGAAAPANRSGPRRAVAPAGRRRTGARLPVHKES